MTPPPVSMSCQRRTLSALALCSLLLAPACHDSSDSSSTGPVTGTLSVEPPTWTTHPARMQEFTAVAAGLAPGVTWATPPGFGVMDMDSDSITLVAPALEGDYELTAVSLDNPQVRRTVAIRVDPYALSFRLADGPPGDSSHRPFADIATSRPSLLAPGDPPSVYLAWWDDMTGVNTLRAFDPDLQGPSMPPVDDLHFNALQVPHVTTDALGNAYWIQQYFFHPFRWYQIGRMDAAGGVLIKDYDASAFGDWWLGVGSDIASDDDGNLLVLVERAGVRRLARLADFFGPAPTLELLEQVLHAPADVRFAVDKHGLLLVADGHELSRWTLTSGAAPVIEELATLQDRITDLDSDGNGLIYVSLPTQLMFLDTLGREALVIEDFTLDTGEQAYFQDIRGFGVDAHGSLRVMDKPQIDLPQLPVRALLPYMVDLVPGPELVHDVH